MAMTQTPPALLRSGYFWYGTALCIAVLQSTLFPHLDIWISHWFWRPGDGWFMQDWGLFASLFRMIPWLTNAFVFGAAILLFVGYLYDLWAAPFDRRSVIYLLSVIALGPGLLTNVILKDHWGRARPSQILEFGGTKLFTPALQPAHQCASNCSFVSGHGSMAFALIAFAFLVPNPILRQRAIWAALGFGVIVGFTRIAQGGHFFSDTLFAALFTIAVAWGLNRWIIVADGLEQAWLHKLGGTCKRVTLWLWDLGQRVRAHPQRYKLTLNLGCLLLFAILMLFVDRPLARALYHPEPDRLTILFKHVTTLGLGAVWLWPTGLATIILQAIARSPRFASTRGRWIAWSIVPAYIFTTNAIAGLLADLIKIFIGRPRPLHLFNDGQFGWIGFSLHSDYWSLPSGHSATIAAAAMALTLLWRRGAIGWWLMALLVASSRVVLTEHYPSDVLAGLWLGTMTTLYLDGVFRRAGFNLDDAKAGIMPLRQVWRWGYGLFGLGSP